MSSGMRESQCGKPEIIQIPYSQSNEYVGETFSEMGLISAYFVDCKGDKRRASCSFSDIWTISRDFKKRAVSNFLEKLLSVSREFTDSIQQQKVTGD